MDEIREEVEEIAPETGSALPQLELPSPFFCWVIVHRGCSGSAVCISTDGQSERNLGIRPSKLTSRRGLYHSGK